MTLVLLAGLSAGVLQDTHGNVIPGRQVNVYSRGTSTPVQVYSDSAGSSPVTQPLTTDSSGNVPGYVAGGVSVDIVDVLTGLREQGEPVLASSTATAPSPDLFSRTKVTGAAVPSVMDSPWNAACDGTTDDTTAVQNAMNACSTIGVNNGAAIPLMIPPGRACKLSSTTPKSYVDIRAHGALLVRNTSYATDKSLFYSLPAVDGTTPVSHFSIRGATLHGAGTETAFQGLLLLGQGSYITLEDCEVTGLPANVAYLRDCDHVWADRNRLINCTVQNPLNFVNGPEGNTNPMKYIWCRGNHLEGFNVLGIALVSATGASRTDPVIDAHINNNTCVSSGTCTGWPIAVEQGGTGAAPNVSRIDISGNTCVQNGAGLYAIALTNDSTPLSNDPLCMSAITISGNRLVSLQTSGVGLLSLASRVAITGNEIEATVDDIKLQGHGTATVGNITVAGNTGHLGSGQQVNVIAGNGTTTGHVDTTTLSSSNTP